MNKLKFVCIEDKIDRKVTLELVFKALCKNSTIKVEYEIYDFKEAYTNKKFFENAKPDWVILDLFDEHSGEFQGHTILENLNISKEVENVIIYTGDVADVKMLQDYESKYPFVKKVFYKGDSGSDKLLEYLMKIVQTNPLKQYTIESDYIDEFSIQLKYFGNVCLDQILSKVKSNYNIPLDTEIKLFKLKAGYSGAILFKFIHNNTWYVLKVSKDVKQIEIELDRAIKFYVEFPSTMLIPIDQNRYYSIDKSAIGIVIKFASNSIPLFDFLDECTPQNLKNILNVLFFEDSMSEHYKNKICAEKVSWTLIFDHFKDYFVTYEEVYKELKSLVSHFNVEDFRNLIVHKNYKKLNDRSSYEDLVHTLCHSDFHSRNILVNNNKSIFLIDTGLIDKNYWCADICRLIVDIFINKIDKGEREFYDIDLISENIDLGHKLIQFEQIPLIRKNENAIHLLNWLIEWVEKIYDGYFLKWQFQLGLMKEFLQMTYRTGSVPPNKRAIALDLAYLCMIEAEKNVPD
ncbi:MAG: hypothetical protein ACK5UE_14330 [Chitinophagales bacterium]|jgi:hypothetical protein